MSLFRFLNWAGAKRLARDFLSRRRRSLRKKARSLPRRAFHRFLRLFGVSIHEYREESPDTWERQSVGQRNAQGSLPEDTVESLLPEEPSPAVVPSPAPDKRIDKEVDRRVSPEISMQDLRPVPDPGVPENADPDPLDSYWGRRFVEAREFLLRHRRLITSASVSRAFPLRLSVPDAWGKKIRITDRPTIDRLRFPEDRECSLLGFLLLSFSPTLAAFDELWDPVLVLFPDSEEFSSCWRRFAPYRQHPPLSASSAMLISMAASGRPSAIPFVEETGELLRELIPELREERIEENINGEHSPGHLEY